MSNKIYVLPEVLKCVLRTWNKYNRYVNTNIFIWKYINTRLYEKDTHIPYILREDMNITINDTIKVLSKHTKRITSFLRIPYIKAFKEERIIWLQNSKSFAKYVKVFQYKEFVYITNINCHRLCDYINRNLKIYCT